MTEMKKKVENSAGVSENFENCFKKLEKILSKLENDIDEYPLEDIIKNYKEGLDLIKLCREKMKDAELRIEKISTEEDI